MNNDDLERRLRDEHGPREAGYVSTPLADAPDGSPRSPHGGRTMRGALILGSVAAGVLAVAAASALLSPGTPEGGFGAGSSEPTTPTVSASPPAPLDCQSMDLALTAEPWGAAAGSRGTVVTVRLADGRYPCFVQRNVGASIRDANGEVLVSAYVPMIYDPVTLNPGDEFTVGIAWSNWCAGDVAEPVSLSVGLSAGSEDVVVPVPHGADPVPPCLGENEPSNLSSTGLQTDS
jgi:hypothetical protein